jgi:hypothetical protein
MPLEAAQLLCTAIWVDEVLGFTPRALNAEEREALNSRKSEIKHLPLEERPLTPYLPMMYNHPCTIWTRSSLDNFEWVHCYANALNDEYHYRYGKLHKSVVEVINKLPEPKNMPRQGLTPFLMAMPDELKDESDVIGSYRLYYHTDKATFAKWSHRDTPDWWDEGLAWYDKRITAT